MFHFLTVNNRIFMTLPRLPEMFLVLDLIYSEIILVLQNLVAKQNQFVSLFAQINIDFSAIMVILLLILFTTVLFYRKLISKKALYYFQLHHLNIYIYIHIIAYTFKLIKTAIFKFIIFCIIQSNKIEVILRCIIRLK